MSASIDDSVTLPLHAQRAVDVLVAGGGVAGVYAALGAADHGASVLLVEQHGFVGGQGTAGGVHSFCGETRVVNDRWREMVRRLDAFGGIAAYRPNGDGRPFDCESLKFVLQEMLAEAGVELLLHTQVLSVDRDGDRVAAVVLANKSGLTRIEPAIAVDATGDADLVARGGWPFRKGGPVLMPGDPPSVDESAGRLQLPMSLYFTLVDSGEAVEPQLPPGCPSYADDEEVPMITVIPHGHHVTVKMKVIGHDATDGASLSAAEQAGRRQMMGVVHYLQTHGYRGARYPNHRLAWVAPHIGIREGRRVEALYQLSADDILAGRHFPPDGVAVGSYHTDYHWPTVVQRAGTGVTVQCPPHQIPLRAMRPREATNLLVPGRCLGGDHLATSLVPGDGHLRPDRLRRRRGGRDGVRLPGRSRRSACRSCARACAAPGSGSTWPRTTAICAAGAGMTSRRAPSRRRSAAWRSPSWRPVRVLIAYIAGRIAERAAPPRRTLGNHPWGWVPGCRSRPEPRLPSTWRKAGAIGPRVSSRCRPSPPR